MSSVKACPKCNTDAAKVIMTRKAMDESIFRRRHCPLCDHRWYTYQPPEQPIPHYAIEWFHDIPTLRNHE